MCTRLPCILQHADKNSMKMWMLTRVLFGRWTLRCCHRRMVHFWLTPCKTLDFWMSGWVGKAALGLLDVTWLSWSKEGYCCPQRSAVGIPELTGYTHRWGVLGLFCELLTSLYLVIPLCTSSSLLHPLQLQQLLPSPTWAEWVNGAVGECRKTSSSSWSPKALGLLQPARGLG